MEAMEIIHGAPLPKTIPAPVPKAESKKLLLPERNGNADAVIRYLKGRGIHDVIIRYCLENDLLFESRKYHSAVFLGYDKDGNARYGNGPGEPLVTTKGSCPAATSTTPSPFPEAARPFMFLSLPLTP